MKSLAPALVLVLLAGLAETSLAAPSSEEEGRNAFVRAKRYFEAEEYEAALPHFQKAYELSGHRDSTIFGLAQCLRLLKRYEEAIKRFEEYLQTDPEDRAEVQETIALLKDLEADRKRRGASPGPAPGAPKTTPKTDSPPKIDTTPKTDASTPPAKPPTLTVPPPSPDTPLTVTTAPDHQDDDSLFESPLFWIITGVVVAGAGVAVGVAAGSSSDPVLYGGSTNVVLFPGGP